MKGITMAMTLLVASVGAVSHADNIEPLTELDNDLNPHPQRRVQKGPNARKRMATWRKAHNRMRKKYHVEYGGEYTPIKWNMSLKREAEAWANQLVKDCSNRSPGNAFNPNDFGVSSAMKSGTRGFQNPMKVMQMWEKKLPLGYPSNRVMTQVLWTKTEYLGCADASSAVGADKTCTVSVCYYGKAGNCALNRFGGNWTEAVLYGPACSLNCPTNLETC